MAVQATSNDMESSTAGADSSNHEAEMEELRQADTNLQPIFCYLENGQLPADNKKACKLCLNPLDFQLLTVCSVSLITAD